MKRFKEAFALCVLCSNTREHAHWVRPRNRRGIGALGDAINAAPEASSRHVRISANIATLAIDHPICKTLLLTNAEVTLHQLMFFCFYWVTRNDSETMPLP